MNKFMKIADEMAKQNLLTDNGGPFGAVVVKDNTVVGVGNNHVLKNNDPTAHAEVMAIRNACENLNTYDLTGCQLYTSCYPCPMCLSATIWSNIKLVYYGNTQLDADEVGFRDDFIYKYIQNLPKEQDMETLKLLQMDRETTIQTFRDFQKKMDKTIY